MVDSNSENVSPKEAEKRVSAAVSDVVEDDSLLIEEDGDFFWVIQKVVWGSIRSIFVFALIAGLLWFIWRGSSTPESLPEEVTAPEVTVSQETEKSGGWFSGLFGGNGEKEPESSDVQETPAPKGLEPSNNIEVSGEQESGGWFSGLFGGSNKKEAESPIAQESPDVNTSTTPPTNINVPSNTNTPAPQGPVSTQDIYEVSRWAYNLEYERESQSSTVLAESVKWLKNAKIIGEIGDDYLRSQDPGSRTYKLEEVIAQGEVLMSRYEVLTTQLQSEYDVYFAQGTQANQQVKALDEAILKSVKEFKSSEIDQLLTQKVRAQQFAAENLSNAKTREILLRNMSAFANLLQQKMLPLFSRPTEIRSSDR